MSVTAQHIAEIVKGQLVGDPDLVITGVASLKEAKAAQASFLGNKKYQHQLESSAASLVLVSKDVAAGSERGGKTFIVCDNVDYSFSQVIMIFAPPKIEYAPGVHPSAVVDATVKLGRNVHIGANAVIEAGAEIGDETMIGAGCYIGHNTKVGAQCLIYPNVTIMFRCTVGNKVILHPGVVIGGDGFGFVPTPRGLVKVPQTGTVQIDDDVEIGANTTVDRARFGRTWIKANVKIDNQVMVAHNVVIGESSILVAQSGIAGSAELGRGVVLAAKSGVNGHITLGDGVQVAGTSGVVKSLPAGAIAVGTPAETQREFMARFTLPGRFEKLKSKVEELKAELAELKQKS
jgi:UDP-3-O-[3-hydroxymyristoyl] glucosamine N-acyltransferase